MLPSEWKQKFNEVDKDDTDSLEFSLRNKFVFRPDLTLPLTGSEILTVANGILVVSVDCKL